MQKRVKTSKQQTQNSKTTLSIIISENLRHRLPSRSLNLTRWHFHSRCQSGHHLKCNIEYKVEMAACPSVTNRYKTLDDLRWPARGTTAMDAFPPDGRNGQLSMILLYWWCFYKAKFSLLPAILPSWGIPWLKRSHRRCFHSWTHTNVSHYHWVDSNAWIKPNNPDHYFYTQIHVNHHHAPWSAHKRLSPRPQPKHSRHPTSVTTPIGQPNRLASAHLRNRTNTIKQWQNSTRCALWCRKCRRWCFRFDCSRL